MTIYDANVINSELCNCGRSSTKRHCPSCGLANSYALKDKASIQNPHTGEMEKVNVFRCRNCNLYYNEYQWKNECKAPRVVRHQSKKEVVKQDEANIMIQRAKDGEHFDHNNKLKFARVTGMTYDFFMDSMKRAGLRKEDIMIKQLAEKEQEHENSNPFLNKDKHEYKPAPPPEFDSEGNLKDEEPFK